MDGPENSPHQKHCSSKDTVCHPNIKTEMSMMAQSLLPFMAFCSSSLRLQHEGFASPFCKEGCMFTNLSNTTDCQ
eukprot:5084322-Amphidinium_carterae.1